jgi:hypothetical protein
LNKKEDAERLYNKAYELAKENKDKLISTIYRYLYSIRKEIYIEQKKNKEKIEDDLHNFIIQNIKVSENTEESVKYNFYFSI